MHQHFGSSWALVVTQPEEGNAVGLTELGELERMKHEFAARKVQVYVISCADAGANEDWLRDVHSATGYSVSFPVIHDGDFEICKKLGMMPPGGAPDDEGRLRDLLRGVYLVDTAKRVRVIMHYPASVGWSSYEILRCFDALFRADAQLATPVNWIARRPRPPCFAARARDAPPQEGRDAFLQPEVETSDALRDFPRGLRSIEVPSGQDYLRLTADPRDPASAARFGRRRGDATRRAPSSTAPRRQAQPRRPRQGRLAQVPPRLPVVARRGGHPQRHGHRGGVGGVPRQPRVRGPHGRARRGERGGDPRRRGRQHVLLMRGARRVW